MCWLLLQLLHNVYAELGRHVEADNMAHEVKQKSEDLMLVCDAEAAKCDQRVTTVSTALSEKQEELRRSWAAAAEGGCSMHMINGRVQCNPLSAEGYVWLVLVHCDWCCCITACRNCLHVRSHVLWSC